MPPLRLGALRAALVAIAAPARERASAAANGSVFECDGAPWRVHDACACEPVAASARVPARARLSGGLPARRARFAEPARPHRPV